VNTIDNRLAEMQELQEIERIEEEAGLKTQTPSIDTTEHMASSFMSESVYGKLNSPKARKRRAMRILYLFHANERSYRYTSTAKTSRSRH